VGRATADHQSRHKDDQASLSEIFNHFFLLIAHNEKPTRQEFF
jgi:hypothetical protein